MEDYEKALKIIEAMRSISPEDRQMVMFKLLENDDIDIPQLIGIYSKYLLDFKRKAKSDIRKLSQAGLTILEKPIKKISQIKSDDKRKLHTALANVLIEGQGYFGTQYQEEMKKHIDMSEVDMDWYNDCWKLETVENKSNSK
jgi:hypothetical protein